VVADAADDADGVTGLGLTYGRYRDCPRSQPPFTAEDNLNPEYAEAGLCPAQPASECARARWPADRLVGSRMLAARRASCGVVIHCQVFAAASQVVRFSGLGERSSEAGVGEAAPLQRSEHLDRPRRRCRTE
jgi:hypothetical protein